MSAEHSPGGEPAAPVEPRQPADNAAQTPEARLRQRLAALYGPLEAAAADETAQAELDQLEGEETDSMLRLSMASLVTAIDPERVRQRRRELAGRERQAEIETVLGALAGLNAFVERAKPHDVPYDYLNRTDPYGRPLQDRPGVWKVHALDEPASRFTSRTIRYDIPGRGARWLETIMDGYWVPGVANPADDLLYPIRPQEDETQPQDARGLLLLADGRGALLNRTELEEGWKAGTAFYVPADYFEPLEVLRADFRATTTVIAGLTAQRPIVTPAVKEPAITVRAPAPVQAQPPAPAAKEPHGPQPNAGPGGPDESFSGLELST